MPLSNVRYVVANRTWTEHGTRLLLDLVQLGVGLQGESSRLNADVIRFSHGTARLRIYDPSKTEFEPPVPKIAAAESTEDVGYRMGLDKSGAMFIVPKGTEHITFVVHLESLFYADDVKQLAVRVPSARMLYGLRGPNGATFVKAHQSSRHAFYRPFNSDDSANQEFNSGVHAFVVIYTGVGKATLGLFLLNSDDIDLTWSEKSVATFRTSGGVLDLFMFVGPSPQSVVKQYLRVVGFPAMPSPTLVRMGVPRTLLLRLDGGINPESFGYVEATLPVRDPAFPPVVMRASGKERYQCKKPGNETLEIVDFTHPSGMHLWLESLRSHISLFPNLVLVSECK
ncbi:lysosomal alpha-glucosidase-like [Haemaphysalis longicornis]